MKHFKLGNAKSYELHGSRILIVESNAEVSFGYLELEPGKKLEEHDRRVDEELIQIEGESTVTVFASKIEEFTLKKGDYLKIPAGIKHVHANNGSAKSLTLWKFEGDIQSIIKKITS